MMGDSMELMNEPLFQQGNEHQVFLSYTRRGESTQDSFRSLLYSSLRKTGMSVCEDHISSIEQLQRIIEGSNIIIIIFSKHYASSERCLKELTKIMELRKAYDQVVLPIFYGVDRSDVQDPNQESSFGRAFQRLVQGISLTEDEVSTWRTTLDEAGGLHGFVVPNFQSKNENEDIQNIVKHVRHILDRKVSFDTDGLVGVHSRLKEVIKMLQERESKDFISIGIWGMTGIGKTTIAKLVFDYIKYEFEYTCFLSIVMKEWKKEGEVYIQRQLLSAIRQATDAKFNSIESVRVELKKRLHHKKVLVVLDDVNHLEQLNALCASPDWFGKGSRMIITTRDSYLLEAFKVDGVYSMKPLNDDESLELFNRVAFKYASDPEEKCKELSKKAVAHAEGLPLALEDLGSVLQGQPLMKWESMLMKLSIIPPPNTYNKLKCSFDSLKSKEKEICLSIVFFYLGEDKDDVIEKLDGPGCDAKSGIRVLVDQSYVTIDNNNKLRMHNMMQLTGRQIIRQIPQNDDLLKGGQKYEVFLSFRGEDTRTTFTSHLYSALHDAGIIVFKDDVELSRGKRIKTELLQAIGSSKISIIIFSRDYAGSKWCLEELSIIMELHRSKKQVVLPMFYHVEASEVRNQTDSFEKAYDGLVNRIKPPEVQVSKWNTALREAGEISGFPVPRFKAEDEIVKTIVGEVCRQLNKKDLFVARHPVGVDNRMQEVITMLQNHQSKDRVMLGIWGMGGVGKTTIAKAIYNKIGPTFQGRSYLSEIREKWNKEDDKVKLQSQLLQDICWTTKMEIRNIESGKSILSDRLRHKKALVVLDDVDNPAQVSDLVGNNPNWCGKGSTIIITSRNKKLLLKMGFHVYPMKNLNDEESIELFSRHAFKQASPKEGFTELSRDIVAYSGQLPLALEELGLYFDGSLLEWKHMLEKLKKVPNPDILKELRKSFDGLSDDCEKKIFLDISCFFIGMDKNDVTHILNGCDFFADTGMTTLEEQSLLTIGEENKLDMHNLLRDMGREIVREKSKEELGRRSRLWFYKDAQHVLLKCKGTKAVEGLSMHLSESKEKHFRTKAFKKMEKLRLLHLVNVRLKGRRYDYISKDLRWLCWHSFALERIPQELCQKKLVVIDLQYSNLRQVWKKTPELKKLKILNLSYSHDLLETPDFSNLPNLVKLILKSCRSLSEIHDSIGLLNQLVLLDLEDCVGLSSLPTSTCNLKCLKTFILSGCNNIKNLEEIIEKMNFLTTRMTPTIKQRPFSSARRKIILYPTVHGHEGSSNLNSLCSISTHESCMAHVLIQIGKNSQTFRSISKIVSKGLNRRKYSDDRIFPGNNDPYWRSFKGEGDSVKFEVPTVEGYDHVKGMTICCLYYSSSDLSNKTCESCINCLMIINYTKQVTLVRKKDQLASLKEMEMKEILSNPECDNKVEVKVVFRNGFTVKKIIVYLIYNESFDEQTEPLPSTNLIAGTKHKCEEESKEAHQYTSGKKVKRI